MIKVLVADDHPIVRQGLKQILAATSDMVIGGEALNGHEVLDKVRADHWDVVVLDMTMPGLNGLEVMKELKRERPNLPVLVLSIHAEEQFAVRAIKAGAAGYMTKESAPEELVNAIRKVFAGGKYVSLAMAEQLVNHLVDPSERPPHETLSDREYRVLCLIASGKTVGAIAKELSLSVNTISTYRARILEKMNMKNNAELMHYAIQHRLVKPDE